MSHIRTGTVGYSYRDWVGTFYPEGTAPRRQLAIYAQNFSVCELTQFMHAMPEAERIANFTQQVRSDLLFFVRIHNTFTHCTDIGLALTLARHFRKAFEPMAEAGKLAGLVAAFPYAFKNSPATRNYIEQLARALEFDGAPLQADFRHPSWITPEAQNWLAANRIGLVCVDEPELPGLLPGLAVATADRVLVRLHGRNADSWWSGNQTTRYDYCYSAKELNELHGRYEKLLVQGKSVNFIFQNSWQAQAADNARQWQQLVHRAQQRHHQSQVVAPDQNFMSYPGPTHDAGAPFSRPTSPVQISAALVLAGDDDALRPPLALPLSEVKSRVSLAFSDVQGALELPPRN